MKVSLGSSQIDPSTSHRLPTLSASQALKDLETQGCLSTGVKLLDRALSGVNESSTGGFERGKVSEIWGPSGAGKTTLVHQVTCETIRNGHDVVWIDCFTPLSQSRLEILKELERSSPLPTAFHHLSVLGLTHLLALILHTPNSFPQSPSLLVIDGLETLLDLDFPRLPWTAGSKTEQQKWVAGRRYAMLGSLISGLNKLAILHGMGVVVTTGCGTRIRSEQGQGAALAPGIGGSEWESGIWSRTVMFRDFNGRFIGVQKNNGRNAAPLDPVGEVGMTIPFEINKHGVICRVDNAEPPIDRNEENRTPSSSIQSSTKPSKKRFYEEIADSDDEKADEYGWLDLDEDTLATEGLADEQFPEAELSEEESQPRTVHQDRAS